MARSTIGKTWWSRRWLEALEEVVDPGRLQRGRRYARNGSVLSISEADGGVIASVLGSWHTPYSVRITLKPLSDEAWQHLLEVLGSQAAFSARLLNGEMPDNIEEALQEAGVSLFPQSHRDLDTSCSCPDWANPCKHVAAVYYVLAERFDDDPFLLFRLRGRTREQVMHALLSLESEGEDQREADSQFGPAPDVSTPGFWQAARPLNGLPISVGLPKVRLPVLKRLGEPPFGQSIPLEDKLGPQLDAVSRAAVAAAYLEDEKSTEGETTR